MCVSIRRQPPYTNSDKYAALSERLQRNAQSQHVLGQPSGQTHHRMPDREQSYSRFQVCLSKVSVQQKINQLFFEHFKGTYQTENVEEGEIAVITFTYPTLS